MPRRRTVVTHQSGTPYERGWLPDAVQASITWEPSQEERWSLRVPLDQAHALLGVGNDTDDWGIEEPFREVQLWRGDQLLTWGPAISQRVAGDVLEVEGAGAGWYMNRKIGPGARPNLLEIDDTDPLDGWSLFTSNAGFTTGALAPDTNIDQSTAPTTGWPGATMRFTSTLADGPGDDFTDPVAVRFVRINAAAYAHTVTFSAWRWFESFTRPNLRRSGLGLAILDTDWTDLYTDARWATWENLAEQRSATPERARVTIEVPASGVDLIVACIITVPRGVTHLWRTDLDWDGGLEFSGEDQADIAFKVADHCNGNAASPYTFATDHPLAPWAGGSIGKSDVNITTSSPATGVLRDRRFLFPSNTTGKAALADLADLADGLEWGVAYTSTTRTFTTYSPKIGSYRGTCPLRLTAAGATMSDVRWAVQGDQGRNVVHAITAGDSRATGSASDTSDFADGLTLDEVITAPADIADADLADWAEQRRQAGPPARDDQLPDPRRPVLDRPGPRRRRPGPRHRHPWRSPLRRRDAGPAAHAHRRRPARAAPRSVARGCDVTTAAMPPDLPAVIQALRDRVDSLERTQPQATTPVYPTGLSWSAPTDLPIRGSKDLRIESLWADTVAAVAGDTTWDLKRNGVTVGSVTVAAGDSHGHANLAPPVVGDIFDVFTVTGTGAATVRALGRSSSPDSPAVGSGGPPKAWCAQGAVEGGTNPTGTTVTGPDTSAHTASYFLVLVALTVTNGTGGAATPSLSGYIVVGGSSLTQSPWQLPQQTMANNDRIVTTMPCIVEAGTSVDFHISDANTSGCGLEIGITVVEVDSVTGACCTAPS